VDEIDEEDDELIVDRAIARAGSISDPYLCCPITGC